MEEGCKHPPASVVVVGFADVSGQLSAATEGFLAYHKPDRFKVVLVCNLCSAQFNGVVRPREG